MTFSPHQHEIQAHQQDEVAQDNKYQHTSIALLRDCHQYIVSSLELETVTICLHGTDFADTDQGSVDFEQALWGSNDE